MSYTVTWQPSASDELLEIWLAASSSDREAIAMTAHSVDRLLKFNPEAIGEARSGAARVLFARPLIVTYEVRTDDRIVVVLAVHRPPDSSV